MQLIVTIPNEIVGMITSAFVPILILTLVGYKIACILTDANSRSSAQRHSLKKVTLNDIENHKENPEYYPGVDFDKLNSKGDSPSEGSRSSSDPVAVVPGVDKPHTFVCFACNNTNVIAPYDDCPYCWGWDRPSPSSPSSGSIKRR